MKLKKTQKELGVNPDPEVYEDVKTSDGWYRRKKKGNKAGLNSVMKAYMETTKYSSPAAKLLLERLKPWTEGFELKKVNAKISGRLKKSYVESGKMTFEHLKDLDIQPNRPLDMLLKSHYHAIVKNGEVIVTIDVREGSIELKNSLFTDFYFEIILVWGDLMKKNGLRIESEESKVYKKGKVKSERLALRLVLPTKNEPWMVLLKVSCTESKIPVLSPRHFGMKVLEVGD
jgi:hypothetical protein